MFVVFRCYSFEHNRIIYSNWAFLCYATIALIELYIVFTGSADAFLFPEKCPHHPLARNHRKKELYRKVYQPFLIISRILSLVKSYESGNIIYIYFEDSRFFDRNSFTEAWEEILFWANVLLTMRKSTSVPKVSGLALHCPYFFYKLSKENTHNFTYLWSQKRWSQYVNYNREK